MFVQSCLLSAYDLTPSIDLFNSLESCCEGIEEWPSLRPVVPPVGNIDAGKYGQLLDAVNLLRDMRQYRPTPPGWDSLRPVLVARFEENGASFRAAVRKHQRAASRKLGKSARLRPASATATPPGFVAETSPVSLRHSTAAGLRSASTTVSKPPEDDDAGIRASGEGPTSAMHPGTASADLGFGKEIKSKEELVVTDSSFGYRDDKGIADDVDPDAHAKAVSDSWGTDNDAVPKLLVAKCSASAGVAEVGDGDTTIVHGVLNCSGESGPEDGDFGDVTMLEVSESDGAQSDVVTECLDFDAEETVVYEEEDDVGNGVVTDSAECSADDSHIVNSVISDGSEQHETGSHKVHDVISESAERSEDDGHIVSHVPTEAVQPNVDTDSWKVAGECINVNDGLLNNEYESLDDDTASHETIVLLDSDIGEFEKRSVDDVQFVDVAEADETVADEASVCEVGLEFPNKTNDDRLSQMPVTDSAAEMILTVPRGTLNSSHLLDLAASDVLDNLVLPDVTKTGEKFDPATHLSESETSSAADLQPPSLLPEREFELSAPDPDEIGKALEPFEADWEVAGAGTHDHSQTLYDVAEDTAESEESPGPPSLTVAAATSDLMQPLDAGIGFSPAAPSPSSESVPRVVTPRDRTPESGCSDSAPTAFVELLPLSSYGRGHADGGCPSSALDPQAHDTRESGEGSVLASQSNNSKSRGLALSGAVGLPHCRVSLSRIPLPSTGDMTVPTSSCAKLRHRCTVVLERLSLDSVLTDGQSLAQISSANDVDDDGSANVIVISSSDEEDASEVPKQTARISRRPFRAVRRRRKLAPANGGKIGADAADGLGTGAANSLTSPIVGSSDSQWNPNVLTSAVGEFSDTQVLPPFCGLARSDSVQSYPVPASADPDFSDARRPASPCAVGGLPGLTSSDVSSPNTPGGGSAGALTSSHVGFTAAQDDRLPASTPMNRSFSESPTPSVLPCLTSANAGSFDTRVHSGSTNLGFSDTADPKNGGLPSPTTTNMDSSDSTDGGYLALTSANLDSAGTPGHGVGAETIVCEDDARQNVTGDETQNDMLSKAEESEVARHAGDVPARTERGVDGVHELSECVLDVDTTAVPMAMSGTAEDDGLSKFCGEELCAAVAGADEVDVELNYYWAMADQYFREASASPEPEAEQEGTELTSVFDSGGSPAVGGRKEVTGGIGKLAENTDVSVSSATNSGERIIIPDLTQESDGTTETELTPCPEVSRSMFEPGLLTASHSIAGQGTEFDTDPVPSESLQSLPPTSKSGEDAESGRLTSQKNVVSDCSVIQSKSTLTSQKRKQESPMVVRRSEAAERSNHGGAKNGRKTSELSFAKLVRSLPTPGTRKLSVGRGKVRKGKSGERATFPGVAQESDSTTVMELTPWSELSSPLSEPRLLTTSHSITGQGTEFGTHPLPYESHQSLPTSKSGKLSAAALQDLDSGRLTAWKNVVSDRTLNQSKSSSTGRKRKQKSPTAVRRSETAEKSNKRRTSESPAAKLLRSLPSPRTRKPPSVTSGKVRPGKPVSCSASTGSDLLPSRHADDHKTDTASEGARVRLGEVIGTSDVVPVSASVYGAATTASVDWNSPPEGIAETQTTSTVDKNASIQPSDSMTDTRIRDPVPVNTDPSAFTSVRAVLFSIPANSSIPVDWGSGKISVCTSTVARPSSLLAAQFIVEADAARVVTRTQAEPISLAEIVQTGVASAVNTSAEGGQSERIVASKRIFQEEGESADPDAVVCDPFPIFSESCGVRTEPGGNGARMVSDFGLGSLEDGSSYADRPREGVCSLAVQPDVPEPADEIYLSTSIQSSFDEADNEGDPINPVGGQPPALDAPNSALAPSSSDVSTVDDGAGGKKPWADLSETIGGGTDLNSRRVSGPATSDNCDIHGAVPALDSWNLGLTPTGSDVAGRKSSPVSVPAIKSGRDLKPKRSKASADRMTDPVASSSVVADAEAAASVRPPHLPVGGGFQQATSSKVSDVPPVCSDDPARPIVCESDSDVLLCGTESTIIAATVEPTRVPVFSTFQRTDTSFRVSPATGGDPAHPAVSGKDVGVVPDVSRKAPSASKRRRSLPEPVRPLSSSSGWMDKLQSLCKFVSQKKVPTQSGNKSPVGVRMVGADGGPAASSVPSASRSYRCPYCPLIFPSYTDFFAHFRMENATRDATSKREGSSDDKGVQDPNAEGGAAPVAVAGPSAGQKSRRRNTKPPQKEFPAAKGSGYVAGKGAELGARPVPPKSRRSLPPTPKSAQRRQTVSQDDDGTIPTAPKSAASGHRVPQSKPGGSSTTGRKRKEKSPAAGRGSETGSTSAGAENRPEVSAVKRRRSLPAAGNRKRPDADKSRKRKPVPEKGRDADPFQCLDKLEAAATGQKSSTSSSIGLSSSPAKRRMSKSSVTGSSESGAGVKRQAKQPRRKVSAKSRRSLPADVSSGKVPKRNNQPKPEKAPPSRRRSVSTSSQKKKQ